MTDTAAASALPFAKVPGASVIRELVRLQAGVPPRSRLARIVGRTPLGPESTSWWMGAVGEIEVGRRLAVLGDGFTVLHAVPVGSRGSDIDHVIIGGAGVFLVNTKHHDEKKVWVGRSGLRVNGSPTDHVRNARFDAKRVGRMLVQNLQDEIPVFTLIAVHGAASVTVKQQPDGVTVLPATRLVGWLKSRPAALAPEKLDTVVRLMSTPQFWEPAHAEPLSETEREQFESIRHEVTRAKHTRNAWAGGALVTCLAASAAIVASALGALGI